jgi:regulation of enolase protein 1 (concanavalin A-like superfamily)
LLLNSGTNIIAVEVHQSVLDSSDLSFDLSLTATLATTTPGPMPPPTPTPAPTPTPTPTPTPSPTLPAGWSSRDIGAVPIAGSASHANGTYTVRGSGSDIWTANDAFHFVYRTLNGDGQITARVASVQNTHQWAKAGVMIRESLGANAKEASVVVCPGADVVLLNRTTTGGTTNATFASGSAPYWVRLVRAGSTFTAYRSADGNSWSTIGSVSIPMTSSVYIGLAVCSKNATTLNTSTFTNVAVSGATGGATLSRLTTPAETTAAETTARKRDLAELLA